MKICYLATAGSIHTAKWANHFSRKGHQVEIISFEPGRELDSDIALHFPGKLWPCGTHYLAHGPEVRRLLQQINPDLVHAHYASGYGTLGRLCGFHPHIISVWGSDIFEFPRKSLFHRQLVKSNLNSAEKVCSTSQALAAETRKYYQGPIEITPFGVDCERFCPLPEPVKSCEEFVVGTIKSLQPLYGIEYLIRAFAIIVERYSRRRKLRLVIAGDGHLRPSLEILARELGVKEFTRFLGRIPHSQVPELLNTFSVFVAPSLAESFGVAVLEASACGVPVIVSDVGGLPEVVRDRVTGSIFPSRNLGAIVQALEELIQDEILRQSMGTAGRNFVLENYEWSENATRMERVYDSVLQCRLKRAATFL